jgi:hypothetical protein
MGFNGRARWVNMFLRTWTLEPQNIRSFCDYRIPVHMRLSRLGMNCVTAHKINF